MFHSPPVKTFLFSERHSGREVFRVVEVAEAVLWTSSWAADRQAHEDQKPLQLEAGLSGHQKWWLAWHFEYPTPTRTKSSMLFTYCKNCRGCWKLKRVIILVYLARPLNWKEWHIKGSPQLIDTLIDKSFASGLLGARCCQSLWTPWLPASHWHNILLQLTGCPGETSTLQEYSPENLLV